MLTSSHKKDVPIQAIARVLTFHIQFKLYTAFTDKNKKLKF